MNKAAGFLLSEIMTAVIVVAILIAIGFGTFASYERDAMVEQAQASLASIKAQLAQGSDANQLANCTNSLVGEELLANEFLSLTLKSIPMDISDLTQGYTAGIHIHSKKNVDSDNTYVTAVRLYEALKEADEASEDDWNSLRPVQKKKDEIEYFALVSETASCAAPG